MAIDPQIQKAINDAISEVTIFSNPKYGDNPTDKNQLANKNYVDQFGASSIFGAKGDILVGSGASVFGRFGVGTDGTVLTADSTQTYGIKWSAAPLTTAGLFGDGSDGFASFDGISSVNGATLAGNTYTLTRDVFYTNTSVITASVVTASYQIFNQGTTQIYITGVVSNNGANGFNGGNGVNAVGPGGGGSVVGGITAGTLASCLGGVGGGTGGQGNSTGVGFQGNPGGGGSSMNPSIGSSGTNGANGGTGGGNSSNSSVAGGSGGSAGIATIAKNPPRTLIGAFIHADLTSSFVQHQGSANSGGGGGGGGGAGNTGGNPGNGGGGGGSGANGGIIFISSKIINNMATNGIQSNGGNGGNGGNGNNGVLGSDVSVGGGGGGAGGSGGTGGVIIAIYETLIGNGTMVTNPGTGGSPGNGGLSAGGGGQNGSSGANGTAGGSGKIWQFQIT